MSRSKELIIEDWERLSTLDKMYLQEHEYNMICDWQQEIEEREPAEVKLKVKKDVKFINQKHGR